MLHRCGFPKPKDREYSFAEMQRHPKLIPQLKDAELARLFVAQLVAPDFTDWSFTNGDAKHLKQMAQLYKVNPEKIRQQVTQWQKKKAQEQERTQKAQAKAVHKIHPKPRPKAKRHPKPKAKKTC
jgi:hypothetical protein